MLAPALRNDETIISSISVTDIFFDVYLGKWNYRAITKVKTWSYFLTIPKQSGIKKATEIVAAHYVPIATGGGHFSLFT